MSRSPARWRPSLKWRPYWIFLTWHYIQYCSVYHCVKFPACNRKCTIRLIFSPFSPTSEWVLLNNNLSASFTCGWPRTKLCVIDVVCGWWCPLMASACQTRHVTAVRNLTDRLLLTPSVGITTRRFNYHETTMKLPWNYHEKSLD
jgi:hypothetical protein